MQPVPDAQGEDVPVPLLLGALDAAPERVRVRMTDEAEPAEEPEEQVYFTGECTCPHEPEQHGWGHCDVPECTCKAGWEE